ncbi:hypothetical protein D9M68_239330 [compost metagenome]
MFSDRVILGTALSSALAAVVVSAITAARVIGVKVLSQVNDILFSVFWVEVMHVRKSIPRP